MFGLLRCLLGLVVSLICFFVFRKLHVERKIVCYLSSVIIGILVASVAGVFPVENNYASFNSPESAFLYYNPDVTAVELVVPGEYADMVIGKKDETYVHTFLPKSDGQWKIGTGLNSKKIAYRIMANAVIHLFQYADTSDFFIVVVDTVGNTLEISDSRCSTFFITEQDNSGLGKKTTTYYTYVSEMDTQYSLTVDGNIISFTEDELSA